MTTVWGIHGRRPQFEMLRDRELALESAGIGDLLAIGDDRERVAHRLRQAYPDASEVSDGTIRSRSTVLLRFAFGPTLGDLVVHRTQS